MEIKALILEFWQAPQTRTILVLILLDLVTGVMAAIRAGVFKWKELVRFYCTNVLPYVLGYGVAWSLVRIGWIAYIPEVWLQQVIQTLLVLPMVAPLLASIGENLKGLGVKRETAG